MTGGLKVQVQLCWNCGHDVFVHRIVKDPAGKVQHMACALRCPCKAAPRPHELEFLAKVKRAESGDVDSGVDGPPFDVLLEGWPWPGPATVSARRLALSKAWPALPPAANRQAITKALRSAAITACKILIEVQGRGRQRARLDEWKAALERWQATNPRAFERFHPIYRAALARRLTRMERAGDPVAAVKKSTIKALTDAGLNDRGMPNTPGVNPSPPGRKFTHVRTRLLFSVGLIRTIDRQHAAKMARPAQRVAAGSRSTPSGSLRRTSRK